MYFYAQLNGANVCTAVTQTAGPLVGAQFILLSSFDPSVLGKTWNGLAWV